jgi:protein O-GlcNAc transferase
MVDGQVVYPDSSALLVQQQQQQHSHGEHHHHPQQQVATAGYVTHTIRFPTLVDILPAHTRYHVVEGSPLSLKPHYGARYMDRIDALQLSAAEVMSVPLQRSLQLQQCELPMIGQMIRVGAGVGPAFVDDHVTKEDNNGDAQDDHAVVPQSPRSSATFKASTMLAAAHELYKAGDFANALAYCNSALVVQRHRTDVLLLLSAVHYQLKNYDQCIVHATEAIKLKPDLAEAHSNLANALQKSGGNLDLAAVHYRNAIHLKPSFTDSYNNLASLLVQKGQVAQAIQCYNLALNINPALYVVCSNLGDLWRSQSHSTPNARHMAEYYYLQAIRYDQQYAPAWIGLAELWREQQEYARAISCYKSILKFQPGNAETFSGLGLCYTELKQLNEAERYYSAVVNMYRQNAVALANLAGVYYEQGRLDLAIQTYKEAIKIDPNFPEVYNNLSNALREAGFMEDAISCYATCIRIQCGLPPNASIYRSLPPIFSLVAVQRLCVVYNNLGGVLKLQGRVQEAIACFQQVRFLQPDSAEAHANLASAYKDCGKHDYAIVEYRQALNMRADLPDVFANYVHSMQCICDWTDRNNLIARLQECVQYSLATNTLPPVQPFHAMAYPLREDLALRISVAYAQHCKMIASSFNVGKLVHPEQKPVCWESGERLKIGYVSSDFGNHPLSHLMASVFAMHDQNKFEIFCYALSPDDGSEWRRRISGKVEHFLDVSLWNAADIARRMSQDGIHIAVNLNGYTKGAKNEIFALKPAPIQCSYMGFPATTGAEFLQYLITDKIVAPPEVHQAYSEKLALMPNCYFVNDYKQSHMDVIKEENMPSRSEVGLPEDKVIYSCSNQLYKYDPDTLAAWCRILKRVPKSVLWLLRFPPEGEMNIRAEAAKHGIPEERIIFTNVVQKDLHIKRSGLADVFLDTPLCNAHTTGCDVLWSGCPMITLPLRRMASRVAASLVHSAGCPELIVQDHSQYEELAVKLGLDHEYRLGLRTKLRQNRLTCPLFNTELWVKNFEKVFEKMWDLHAQKKEPETFEV